MAPRSNTPNSPVAIAETTGPAMIDGSAAARSGHAASGLTDAEAARLLATHGPNLVPEPPRAGVAARVAAQLRDPMIVLLLAAAAIAVWLGDASDTAVIALVVVLNTAVGVAQELRAERAVAALRRLAAPTATVLRGGVRHVRPAAEIVPGDVIVLGAGDIVAADGEVLEAHRLQADEASLTGESAPVDKAAGDPAAAGTVVTRGRGTMLVTATGPASGLGRIAALVGARKPRPTPLQRRLAALGKVLAGVAVALSAVVAGIGIAAGRPVAEMALTGVSLAVAAVPESLPAVVTLALALGAHRMARRSAVVRSLPAVETLGSVTVVATDKTGTLTEGRMACDEAWTPDGGPVTLSGTGYTPTGVVTPEPTPALRRLLRAAVLCSDADIRPPDDDHPSWWAAGDPTEAALVTAAARAGLDTSVERAAWPRVAEAPFDGATSRMITVHRAARGDRGAADCDAADRNGGGAMLVLCKGAPEALLGTTDRRGLLPSGPHTDSARRVAAGMAARGHRVLAVAEAVTDAGSATDAAGAAHLELAAAGRHPTLRLAGLVALTDPLRASARAAVTALHDAGVTVLLVTGDHPATARSIATAVGIPADDHPPVTGADLESGHDPADTRTADGGHATTSRSTPAAHVYARIRPEQKLDIVAAWQARGHVVAMTGDGVNDAPALRRADIGVAMGGEGSDVAREAADLVLTDDELGTVGAAVEEGRRVYANVRTFLRYALAGGLAEVLVMLAGPLLGLAVPLLPAQILWINMLTHGIPGVAIGAEPADPAAMREPPRPPDEFVLGGGLWRRVAWTGALIAATTLAAGWWSHEHGGAWQSVVFLSLGLAQLGVAVALRRGGTRPRFLDAAVACAVALQLAGIWAPPVRELLGADPLGTPDLLVAVTAAVVPGAVVALTRLRRPSRHRSPTPAHAR